MVEEPAFGVEANVRVGWKADIADPLRLVQFWAMDFDALVPQLWQRYPFLDDESLRVRLSGIREADVAA